MTDGGVHVEECAVCVKYADFDIVEFHSCPLQICVNASRQLAGGIRIARFETPAELQLVAVPTRQNVHVKMQKRLRGDGIIALKQVYTIRTECFLYRSLDHSCRDYGGRNGRYPKPRERLRNVSPTSFHSDR